MCEETRRSLAGGGFEVIFSYRGKFLSLSEMLERQGILKYLRRNGWEPSREALRKRLLKGLHAAGALPKRPLRNTCEERDPSSHRERNLFPHREQDPFPYRERS